MLCGTHNIHFCGEIRNMLILSDRKKWPISLDKRVCQELRGG